MASWNDLQAARQNDLMRYYNSKVVQQDQATPQSAALQEKKNKGGFLGGVGYTLEKLGLGTLRSIEGMTDYLVGGAADILGQDDFAEELMKSDWVNYEHADEWYNPNKVMSFVGDVSSGVGGMLPSITASAAVTLATGGAGAGVGAGLLSQGVGTALFGLGAAGQSTSQAVKETGTLGGKEWLYGTGSGALEAGIEAASGGIGGTLAGTAFGKQLAKTTGGKIATTFLGEGLEEVASDITDPLLKKATGVDKNAKVDWSNLPRTFLVGGATGAVLGGAGRAINAAKAGGFNNLGAIETANKLTKEKAKVNLQQINDKAFEQEQPQVQSTEAQEQTEQAPTPTVVEENQKPIKYAYTPQEIRETENKLGERVQKMDEKTRQEFMESNPQATRNLNEDGTVKPAVTVTQEEIDTYDKNSYSASLQGHEGEFEYTPSKKPTQVIKNVMKKLTQLTQGKAEIVLTDNDLGETAGGKKINGLVKNGIIYLKADSTDAERTMFVGSHEIMHTLEGTREYSNLANFIQSEIKNNPRMRLKYNLDDYISAYAGAQEQNYSNYTKLHEAQTEMYADFVANEILSNPDSVNRLVKDNRNLVKKMLDWVRNALKRIGMTKDERDTYNTLRQMEKLLSNALEAGRGGMALDAVERRYQEARAKAEEQEVNETSQSTTGRLADARMSIDVFTDTKQKKLAQKDKSNRTTPSARFSLEYADEIADNQLKKNEQMNFVVDENILQEGIESTARMVKLLSEHKDILPEDKIGKVLKSNSSYDKSVENTTICVRTLAYNEFVDMVQERVGRPLTQAESFLVSQKLYEIALEPQCLYCYVSLDRKAYNEFLLRYIRERDQVIAEYKASDKKESTIESLYEKYRNNRKHTAPLRKRFDMFIEMAKKGIKPLTAGEISTKAKQSEIAARKDFSSEQWKDMAAYAQSASWAKKQVEYAAYYNDILTLSQQAVNNLNKHYGLRFYSFSDYTAAFIVENMQQVTDAAIRGLKGLGYTKDTDFAKIFAPTGMNINISMYAHKNSETGEWEIDPRQSADLNEAIELREKYPNVGIVVTASTDEGVLWALSQNWSDIVIPFHIVRTGADVAEFYKWQNYTSESADTIADNGLWEKYVNGRKKVSKNIYPAEHQNNRETYLKLIKERGLKPRFERFIDNPNYMKLVNETRRSAKDTPPMQPIFDVKEAEKSFNKFIGKGGYFKGWYKKGVNVETEAKAVAKDVQEGKKANEVEYGRQDLNPEDLIKKRKNVRAHKGGERFSLDLIDNYTEQQYNDFGEARQDERYSLDVETAEEEPSNRIARIQRVTEEQEPKTAREKVEVVKQKAAEKWLALKIETTNVQAGIEEAAKRLGVNVEGKVQKARSSRAAALNMILNNQMDYTGKNKLGKSLKDIFEPVHKKGDAYTVDFYEYLLQQHNVDRMSLEEKAKLDIQRLMQSDAELSKVVKDKELDENERNSLLKKTKNGRKYLQLLEVVNKPVFDESVTAQDSRARVAELQLKHPEFAKMAEEVWNYNKNLLQRRVDAGLITQEIADDLNSKYPHYVPTFRDTGIPGQSTAGASNSKYGVEVKKTIKTAKGSNLDILDISVMMSKQTQAVIRAEAINELAKTLYEAADVKNDFTDVMIMREEDLDEAVLNSEQSDIDYENEKPKNNEVTFYRNGKRVTMAVSQPVFIGFEAFNGAIPYNSPLFATAESINNIFKKGVTAWNPLFLIRNAVRDFQEAIFYTKNGIKKFISNLPKAIKAMAQKSEVWQQYLAIGGHQSGYFNNEMGVYDNRSKIKKGASKIGEKLSFLNEFIEQIPRFNEFMLSIESGKSVEDALLDSAEVTTNFSRGGKLTKTLNRTLIPFLNPSVQGWSKLWRTAVGRKNARQWTTLIVKALAFGLAVGLINDLINGDDEDYKNLNVRDKENYFIFPIGDGKFIKIPKGRVVAALGSVASRTKSLLKGDDKAFDGWFTSVSSMVSPVDQISRDIFSPFRDVKSNTTWYGSAIESSRLQNYAPSQRYDESTSSIAIGLGKVFNYSPKKIHYLIDQYSGVFGDILLPMTTAKAEKDMISSAFVIDSTLQNNISTEFYDTLDSITYAKNAGDPISAILLRYMNKASNGASDLYQQKRDIQNDKSLSNKEKQKQTKIIQATINTVLQSATQNVEKLEQILIDLGYEDLSVKLLKNAAFKKFDEKQQVSATQKFTDYYYASAMAELVGEKKDVKYYFYDEVGGADTAIYLTEIAAITSDKDKNGKSIANSRKTKVHNYIEKLKIPALQKYMLMYLAGYTPSENGKQKIEQYLTKKGYKQEDLVGLWD